MSGEEPRPPRRGRTPAERAGATPLDPQRFAAAGVRPAARLEANDPADGVEPVVRRRRRRRDSRPLFIAAAALTAVAVSAGALAWLTDSPPAVAAGAAHDHVVATPVLSARRAPELLARPVAARNLRAAVQPVIDSAPASSCVEVREGGEALVAHREAEPTAPASNMKLVVAAAALDLLDPAERLVTRFATDGVPTDGATVRGNLYMIGGGDPLLTSDTYEPRFNRGVPPLTDLESVADQVAATGIRTVTGSIVGDGSRYDDVRDAGGWPQRYLTQGQVAPLSALVVNDGWTVDPITGAGGGPATDPSQHAARVMTQLLRARGVQIDGDARSGMAPDGVATLLDVPSLTVAELVQQLLRFSDNTTTELIVKEIGLRVGGTGSTETGLAAVRAWIEESGLDDAGVVMTDGSGLSADGRLTCRLLSSLLADEGPSGMVADGLARPGEDGTLDDRMLAGPLRDSVRAKTGTLRDVTALSGWLHTDGDRDLVFAFLINTPDRQVGAAELRLQEQLLTAMTGHPRSPPLDDLAPLPPAPTG